MTVNAFEKRIENREYFDVPVVVDCRGSVCSHMERVNHVYVVQVGGGSFVCYVNRVLQRKVPHREGLEFCVTGFYAPLVLLI